MDATLFIVSAPSGAGKTSLVKSLVEVHSDLVVSVSHTTRPKRVTEIEGSNYYFVSDVVFQQMIERSEFLEHAHVFNHWYGTSRAWAEQTLAQGIDVILEIDWQGARQVRLAYPQVVGIFILPPSLQVLKMRLETRGLDEVQEIDRRMREAQSEIEHYIDYDYVVVNDNFEMAAADLGAIIKAERLKRRRHNSQNGEIISQLLNK